MKILFVEDDIQLSKAIETFLKIKKHEVEVVHDGEIAIDSIDTRAYDLYILDINLPHVSGVEIARYIRQKDKSSIIIMITAALELDNFIKAHENGCDEYLKKPFHLEELEIIINKHTALEFQEPIAINNTTSYNPKFGELR
jgi:DNA-binding response OmpR family regulator